MTHVIHFMLFYDVPGKAAFSGAENHLFTLMAGQVKAGLQVELAMVVGLPGARLDQKAQELQAQGVKVTQIVYPYAGLGLKAKLLRPLIVRDLWRFMRTRRDAVFHIHPLTNSGALIVLAAWLCRHRAIVLSYHNNEPFLAQQPYKTGLQLMDKVAQRTLAISAAVRDHLVHAVGLDPARTEIVYYGVEIPQQQPDRTALRTRLGVKPDAFVAGLVGRLTEQKDIPTFLKALKQVPDITGLIIGGGELEGPLKAEAQALGLTNCIFAGPQPDGPDLIGCLDVMVLPSRFEGLGLVLLEAMVRHTPIIGSMGGAIPEITEQGKLARLFPVGDVERLASALRDMQQNESTRQSLADMAFARAREKYTVDAMVAATSAFYKKAAVA